MRLKNIHMVNELAIISYIFPLLKPFLKEKTRNRVKVLCIQNNRLKIYTTDLYIFAILSYHCSFSKKRCVPSYRLTYFSVDPHSLSA